MVLNEQYTSKFVEKFVTIEHCQLQVPLRIFKFPVIMYLVNQLKSLQRKCILDTSVRGKSKRNLLLPQQEQSN